MIELRKVGENDTTVTLGWTPIAGAAGYRFSSEKQAKPSHTWDPARATVRFAKGSAWYRVEALGVTAVGEYPPPEPPPPSPPVFGDLLAQISPRIARSTGVTVEVSTIGEFNNALATCAGGSTVRIIANLDGGGSPLLCPREAPASAPITITASPGVTLRNFSQANVSGSYLRLLGLEVAYATIDGIKIDTDAHHVEVDGCHVHHTAHQGISVQPSPNHVQLWNNRIHDCGSMTNQHHGIYFDYTGGVGCVVANNLVYDCQAYGIQVYRYTADLIVVCNTVDGGRTRGGVVVGSEGGETDRVKIIGLIGTNAPWYAVNLYNPSGGDSGNETFDSIGFGNGSGDFQQGAGMTYTNCLHADPLYLDRAGKDFRLRAGSPAIGLIDPARYGLVPALDIDGVARTVENVAAGAYAA